MDMAGFFTKWIRDIRDSQASDGRYPCIAPLFCRPAETSTGAPAWADGSVIVPWRMYQNYADTRILKQHFESARSWVDYVYRYNPDFLWKEVRGPDYGDWLNGDTLVLENYPRGISAIPKEVFATAIFAHSTDLVTRMAKVLGKTDEAQKYEKLFNDIKSAFNKAYVADDGRIKGDTQSCYALALHFNLLDPPKRPLAVKYMLEAIRKYKNHVSTGNSFHLSDDA